MKRRLGLAIVCAVLAVAAAASAEQQPPKLKLWLMFTEPAAERTARSVNDIRSEMDVFNDQLRRDCPRLTVLNTTRPELRQQQAVWNLAFAGPLWPMIKGQGRILNGKGETLNALCRFAKDHAVDLSVRFVTWEEAFGALQEAAKHPETAPDVAQIGSTWVPYFAEQGLLLSQSEPAGTPLQWRNVPEHERVALRYLVDIRLLFYWKQLPQQQTQFSLDATNWENILASLKAAPQPSPPMVMPIGPTFNLLHDYVSLVWAGGGDFWSTGDTTVDLTSEPALRIPLQLAKNDEDTLSLLAFPEMTHEEATKQFMQGAYRAIIEPTGFIARWYKNFQMRSSTSGGTTSNFWDYAGVAVLPVTFKGGSDIVVWSHSKAPALASELARFLASGAKYTDMLARNGHLPAQPDQLTQAFKYLLVDLGSASSQGALNFIDAAKEAVDKGREYPPLAKWPIVIESRAVLEGLQRLWRRLGARNETGVREEAAQVEVVINKQINSLTWLWETAKVWWPLMVGAMLIIAIWQLYLQRKVTVQQRGKILALLLFRAKIHSQLHAYGGNIEDFCLLPDDEIKPKISAYGRHIAITFNRHLAEVVRGIYNEIEGIHSPLVIQTIVEHAFEGAQAEFYASRAEQPPSVKLSFCKDLSRYQITHFGSLLTMILQEWFYNYLKIPSSSIPNESTIKICMNNKGRKKELCIVSPIVIKKEDAAKLSHKISIDQAASGSIERGLHGQGLPLIRDLLWYGFKSKARILTNKQTILIIPIPFMEERKVA